MVKGANATSVSLCFAAIDNLVGASQTPTAVLDPTKVAGKIVVCDRGVNARVNKSLAVKEAGGIGMILVVRADRYKKIESIIERSGEKCQIIGRVVKGDRKVMYA